MAMYNSNRTIDDILRVENEHKREKAIDYHNSRHQQSTYKSKDLDIRDAIPAVRRYMRRPTRSGK